MSDVTLHPSSKLQSRIRGAFAEIYTDLDILARMPDKGLIVHNGGRMWLLAISNKLKKLSDDLEREAATIEAAQENNFAKDNVIFLHPEERQSL